MKNHFKVGKDDIRKNPPSGKIELVLVDSNVIFRRGLLSFLNAEEGFDCLGETGDGNEALQLVRKLQPDIVIIAVELVGSCGIEVGKVIKDDQPDVCVLVMTRHANSRYVAASLRYGLDGYLLKDIAPNDLQNALRLIIKGKTVLNGKVTNYALNLIEKGMEIVDHCLLNERELQILRLVSSGLSNKQIAADLGITTHTVATHVTHVFRKLDVESRAEAMLFALRRGWVVLDRINDRDH